MTNTEDFLAHYGVRGMKWGQRKTYSDRISNARTSLDKNAGSTRKAEMVAAGKFIAKYAGAKLAKIGINKAVRGVSYYNPKSMRGIAFQMNPMVAEYMKYALTAMQVKSYVSLVKDSYAIKDAKMAYDKDARKKSKGR